MQASDIEMGKQLIEKKGMAGNTESGRRQERRFAELYLVRYSTGTVFYMRRGA